MGEVVRMETEDLKNGLKVQLVLPEAFVAYWANIEAMLDQVPHTWKDLTKEHIYDRIMQGTMNVWFVTDDKVRMVFFTQIANYPNARVLEVIWTAGSGGYHLRSLDALDAMFETFAREQECSRIDVFGRDGWERVLASRGFKKIAVVISRDVTPLNPTTRTN